jgi:hypothetical protein
LPWNSFSACDSQIAFDAIASIRFPAHFVHRAAMVLLSEGIAVGEYDAFHWRPNALQLQQAKLQGRQFDQDQGSQLFASDGAWVAEKVVAKMLLRSKTLAPLVLLTSGPNSGVAMHEFKKNYPAPVIHLSGGCRNGDCGAQGGPLETSIVGMIAGMGARHFVGSSFSQFSFHVVKLRKKVELAFDRGRSAAGGVQFKSFVPDDEATLPTDTGYTHFYRGEKDQENSETGWCWALLTDWKEFMLSGSARDEVCPAADAEEAHGCVGKVAHATSKRLISRIISTLYRRKAAALPHRNPKGDATSSSSKLQ